MNKTETKPKHEEKNVKKTNDRMANKMREIRIEKLSINIGIGEAGDKLKKAKKLLEKLSGGTAVLTKGKQKIPALGVRPGLPIGAKVTMRKNIEPLLKRLIESKEKILKKESFTNSGVSFGIDEYLHIPGMDYDPELGIMGMDITVVLERRGYRVKRRKIKPSYIGKNHVITPQEAIKFMQDNYGVIVK